MKWTCSHCGAINAELAFKCHNCPNTSGDELINRFHRFIEDVERHNYKGGEAYLMERCKEEKAWLYTGSQPGDEK